MSISPVSIITVGAFEVNSIVLYDAKNHICYIIDPGGDADKILHYLPPLQSYDKIRILLTHAHFDHISALKNILDITHSNEIYLHPNDSDLFLSPDNQFLPYYPYIPDLPVPNWPLPENDFISPLHTPGHSQGSCSFVVPSLKTVFSGDTLFYNSIGRTDLYGGDFATLIKSIKEQLFSLPDDFRVIPGHGPETSIAFEKQHNPYLHS